MCGINNILRPNVLGATIVGMILSVLLLSCNDDAEKERLKTIELELRQKELDLKERQLEASKVERLNNEPNKTLSQLYDECERSVFLIEALSSEANGISIGSGFILRSDGVGITNYHVLEDVEVAMVHIDESRIYSISEIITVNEEMDYVVFKLACGGQETFNPVKIADVVPKIGEICFAIGNPKGLTKTLSQGIISGYRNRFLQTTAQITNGSSGGVLFNDKGEAVGITTMGYESADLNFALNIVDIDYFRRIQLYEIHNDVSEVDDVGSLAHTTQDVIACLIEYFDALERHDYYSLESVFAEKLTRFYKRTNVSMLDAINEHKRYAKTYPHPKTKIDIETIHIERANDGLTSVVLEIESIIRRKDWSNAKSYRFVVYFDLCPELKIASVYSRILE